MQAFKKIYLPLLIISFLFLSCKKENPIETESQVPQPPTQVNEFDLVGLEGEVLTSFSVNQKEPWRIIAISGTSTYVTDNYGKNWMNVLPDIFSSVITWDPIKANIVYNAIRTQSDSLNSKYGWNVLLLKSTDYGYTWSKSDSGITPYGFYIRTLAIDPLDNNIIFAGMTDVAPYFSGDVYKTSDGGKRWVSLAPSGTLGGSSLGRVLNVVKNAQIPQTILLTHSEHSYFKSQDDGKTWQLKNTEWTISKLSLCKNAELTLATISSDLLISKNSGESFEAINYYPFKVSNLNSVLAYSNDLLFVSTKYRLSDTSLVYYSKDMGSTWAALGTDLDTKTSLDFDSKNNFLYVVMDGVKKGLYRYKLK